MEAYRKKTGRTRLQFQDWGIIKPTWKTEFSDPFVNDPYHVIFCGRAGYEYDSEIDAETGKREIYKSGIKMKVEGETAYEPDILILMERFEEILGKDKKIWREATVIKDRANLLDGKTFIDPKFTDFEPVIEIMLSGAIKQTPVEETSAETLFKTEEDKRAYIKQKEILLEKISNEITKHLPGQAADVKQKRIVLSEKVFNTNSWAEIETYSVKVLEEDYAKLQVEIAKEIKAEDNKIKGKEKKELKIKTK